MLVVIMSLTCIKVSGLRMCPVVTLRNMYALKYSEYGANLLVGAA